MALITIEERTRKTGLDFIEYIPWGSHICTFYQTKEDLFEILVPYFKAGLDNNEFCLWVTSEVLNVQEAEEAMRNFIPDFEIYLNRGQMKILPYTEHYYKNSIFSVEEILSSWVVSFNEALSNGYDGLRVTGNTSWIDKGLWNDFIDYEARFNDVIDGLNINAICTYLIDKCNIQEIIEVVVNHKYTFIKRDNKWQAMHGFELNKTEEKLKISNNIITNILESITDAFFVLDKKWCAIYLNKEAELFTKKNLGVNREELSGKNFWETLPELVDTKLYREFQRAVQEQVSVHFEHLSVYGKMWVYISAYPSKNGLFVYFKDMTEQKMIQEEMARLDRLNLIGEMAAGIGHEVRNPMTTIKGFLQLLSEKDRYLQDREFLDLMIDELDRANSIISEFLSLAKNKNVDIKKRNLNKILNSILPLIQADGQVKDKYINLETQVVSDLLLDEKEIRQLVLNLVRNGLEAMSPGGKMEIRTYSEEDEVVLTVKDSGKGIEPEILEKIGIPFYTTKENGTGLGLAVCYSIASRHNAKIDIKTGTEGTTFSVRFKKTI
ncbi:MEDS domain-containing protein [Pelotomaculum propionicicum]|uniref:MEDS domain-containing protein n=1 Tax=Pelotomaculum propionicicum TaxID=258475 RepID=UPI003B7BFF4C